MVHSRKAGLMGRGRWSARGMTGDGVVWWGSGGTRLRLAGVWFECVSECEMYFGFYTLKCSLAKINYGCYIYNKLKVQWYKSNKWKFVDIFVTNAIVW